MHALIAWSGLVRTGETSALVEAYVRAVGVRPAGRPLLAPTAPGPS